jgi:hypothetical protein
MQDFWIELRGYFIDGHGIYMAHGRATEGALGKSRRVNYPNRARLTKELDIAGVRMDAKEVGVLSAGQEVLIAASETVLRQLHLWDLNPASNWMRASLIYRPNPLQTSW